MVVPIIETMLGDSKQRRKDNLLRFLEMVGNFAGEDGKPVIKPKQLAKLACEEYGYDFDKLSEDGESNQSPEAVIDQVFSDKEQSPQDDPQSPSFIPPNQRS